MLKVILRPNRFYQVVDGSNITFGIVNAQYLLLRDCDDSIIVPETPIGNNVRYRRLTQVHDNSLNTSNIDSDDSVVLATQEQPDDRIFAKPHGTASSSRMNRHSNRRNDTARNIHDLATQRPREIDERTTIHDCPTQRVELLADTETRVDANIHDMETQRLNIPEQVRTIQDMETQKFDDANVENIMEMATQRIGGEKTKKLNNKNTAIHDLETQRLDDPDLGIADIMSMETQKIEVVEKSKTSKKQSIHDIATQQCNQPSGSSIQDLETQKLDAINDVPIEEMETQQVGQPATDKRSIHELETQKVTNNFFKSKNVKGNKNQRLIGGNFDDVIAETDDSDTDEEGVFLSARENPKNIPKSINGTLNSDSETDEEGNFDNLALNKSIATPKDPIPSAFVNDIPNETTADRFNCSSPVLGEDPSKTPSRSLTASPTLADDSMAPTQILDTPDKPLHNKFPVKNDVYKHMEKLKANWSTNLADKQEESDDDNEPTQIIQLSTRMSGTKIKAITTNDCDTTKMNVDEDDDMVPTQIINVKQSIKPSNQLINKSTENNYDDDEPTQLIEHTIKGRKRHVIDSSSDDETDNELMCTKKKQQAIEGKNNIAETNSIVNRLKVHLSSTTKLKSKSLDNSDDKITQNLYAMFDGTNDTEMEQPSPLLTQQLVNILKPTSHNDNSDDSDTPGLSGFANGVPITTKASDKSSNGKTDTAKAKLPFGLYDSDSSDGDFDYDEITSIADRFRKMDPKKLDSPVDDPETLRKSIINETLATMKTKTGTNKRNHSLIDEKIVPEKKTTPPEDNNINSEIPVKRSRKTPSRYLTPLSSPESQEIETILKKSRKTLPKKSRSNLQENVIESPSSSTPAKAKRPKPDVVSSPSSAVRSRTQHKVVFTGLNEVDSNSIRKAVTQLGE